MQPTGSPGKRPVVSRLKSRRMAQDARRVRGHRGKAGGWPGRGRHAPCGVPAAAAPGHFAAAPSVFPDLDSRSLVTLRVKCMKLTSKDRQGRWRVTVGVSPLVKECQGSGEGPPAFNLRGPRTRPRAPPLSEGALKRPHASGPQAVPGPEPGGGGSSILPPPPPPTTSACNNKWRRVSNPG